MAKNFFLEKNIKILKNNCEPSKDDLWQMFELLTYCTVNEEITLDEAEQHAYTLFKKLEEINKKKNI